MSNSDKILAAARGKSSDCPTLMTHVVLGYPSMNESIAIVEAMSRAGAALIELQIPFSDPLADGPTIMQANQEALANGTTPEQCMRAMSELSKRIDTPLLFMSYCNLVFGYKQLGFEHFCKEARDAGACGLIVADVPKEEKSEGYWELASEYDLCPISLVSPVTDDKRMENILVDAQGFIYCVATTGTTGVRKEVASDLQDYLGRVRSKTDLPLAVGFGISTPEQVKSISPHADMAIVGSAMINLINNSSAQSMIEDVEKFTAQLASGSSA